MFMRHLVATLVSVGMLAADAGSPAPPAGPAQTDLDALLQQVLSRRDENWKKLQQYILDEREEIQVTGPSGMPLWGERREFTWYIRDGFFVRSPVAVNGVSIGEGDRRRYEAEFLRQQQERDKRASGDGADDSAPPVEADQAPSPADRGGLDGLDGFIRQTREPQFISSAYFLRFRFEGGRYALVGREALEGREVLRVEYFPTRLFADQGRRREPDRRNRSERDQAYEAEVRRLMSKVSLVTLWIDPTNHQILKYTFDNITADFIPAQWLVRVTDASASMTMGQPFPDVWLPRSLEMRVGMTLAIGRIDLRYSRQHDNYRQAEVTSIIRVPDGR